MISTSGRSRIGRSASSTVPRSSTRLPSGPPHPVRLLFRGELVAIYGPLDEGPGLRPLVML